MGVETKNYHLKNLSLSQFLYAFLLLLFFITPSFAGDALSSTRNIYDKSLAKIISKNERTKKQVMLNYSDGLSNMQTAMQKSGDLDGLLAIRKEMARFEKEKTLPGETTDGLSSGLKEFAVKVQKVMDNADYEKNQNIVDLANRYIAHLEKTKVTMTRQGEIEEAMAVKAEQDKVDEFPAVTAAKFSLAERASRADAARLAEEAVESPVSAHPVVATPPAVKVAISTSSGAQTIMRPCSTCNAGGKIPEPCSSCTGSGNCGRCNGQGKSRSALKGSTTLATCFTCRGSGVCKSCKGEKFSGKIIDCTRCAGKGQVAVPVYVSSYTPDEATMAAYSNVDKASVIMMPMREAMSDYRSRIGKVIESEVIVRSSSSSSRYIYLQDASPGQTSSSSSFIPVNSAVRKEVFAASALAGEGGIIKIKFTFQANGRRFLLSAKK